MANFVKNHIDCHLLLSIIYTIRLGGIDNKMNQSIEIREQSKSENLTQ